MKKKFLSLMMAAAVVATTSVSAFAKDYSWSENLDEEINVDITGNVQSQGGTIIPGNISVSVPTTASFTVNRDRTVKSAPIRVENKGTIPVDVYAYKFADQTPDSNITIVGKSGLDAASHTDTLTLKLSGNRGHAHLKSEPKGESRGNGVYTNEECTSQPQDQAEGVILAHVNASDSKDITLSGETKNDANAPTSAVQDNFVLTLKIKKAKS